MTSTPLQTPLGAPSERPILDLAGVKVFAVRDGTHVTGRVEFPNPVRPAVHIDYHSSRSPTLQGGGGGGGSSPSNDRPGASPLEQFTARERQRLALVQQYLSALRERRPPGRREVANSAFRIPHSSSLYGIACSIAGPAGVSARSLQGWVRKHEAGGPDALRDRYVNPPSKCLSLSNARAADAMRVCSWWAYRIGNLPAIDHRAMHSACSVLDQAAGLGASPLDVLATIDCYYAYPCNRTDKPFKPFARWAKYDYRTWLHRARDGVEYRAQMQRSRQPLITPDPSIPRSRNLPSTRSVGGPSIPPPRDRARDASCPRTREALESVIPAQAGIQVSPLLDAVHSLDDRLRMTLLSALRGDRQAIREAAATLPLWYDPLPAELREIWDTDVQAWRTQHCRASPIRVTAYKLDMVLAAVRREMRVQRERTNTMTQTQPGTPLAWVDS